MGLLRKVYASTFGAYYLSSLLSKELKDGWRVLDAGCGRFSALFGVERRKKMYTVGLDFYEPYILKCKELSIHNEYVLGDVRGLLSIFGPKSFDCVMATGVLEHLSKDDGIMLIEQMERVATRKIILTTPNGFLPTYAGPKDNPTETHLSGWTAKELRKLGFEVYGLNSFKGLWKIDNGQAVVRFRPRRLFLKLTLMTGALFYHIPSLAFQLFFIKILKAESKDS